MEGQGDPIEAVQRPDGSEIHWHESGAGPVVLLVHHTLWSYPGLYAELIADLERDHRVVLYDPRGCGRSTRSGPYDPATDAGDLKAVAEAAGPVALALSLGDGFNRAVRAAAAAPGLISKVMAIAPASAAVLPRSELRGTDVLAASDSVIDMMVQLMKTDPRSALRTMITATNPDLDEQAIRKRVDRVSAYTTAEASYERTQAWLEDDLSDEARAMGGRLWILHGGADPLFEGVLGSRVSELYPDAHTEQLSDGPITRPELTAARVREALGG